MISHVHTGHYLTSRPAIEKYIKGSFEKENTGILIILSVLLQMEKRDSGLYQVAYSNGIEK